MVWIHAINETAAGDFAEHVLNPMSPEKLRTLGRRLRLEPGHRILDVGAGRCGPGLILAREFGCLVTAVEPYGDFMDEAQGRVEMAGLTNQFEFIRSTGADFAVVPGRYDVTMCIGASWAWGGLEGTLAALAPGVRPGGHVVVGEVYSTPGPDGCTLADLVASFESAGLAVVTLIRSTIDDWDTYSSIKATSLLDWLHANPGHPDVAQVRAWREEALEELTVEHIGWAVLAGRKADT